MAFTNIPNANLQVGAPLRSVDILALRDNIPAVMNGDTGAPKIKAAAFDGQSGAAPVFTARAWVNFDGTGAVNIRASGNVTIITDLGVGDYLVNFAVAMPDVNYCAVMSCGQDTNSFAGLRVANSLANTPRTTTALRVSTTNVSSGSDRANVDDNAVSVAIFR